MTQTEVLTISVPDSLVLIDKEEVERNATSAIYEAREKNKKMLRNNFLYKETKIVVIEDMIELLKSEKTPFGKYETYMILCFLYDQKQETRKLSEMG